MPFYFIFFIYAFIMPLFMPFLFMPLFMTIYACSCFSNILGTLMILYLYIQLKSICVSSCGRRFIFCEGCLLAVNNLPLFSFLKVFLVRRIFLNRIACYLFRKSLTFPVLT